MGINTYDEHTCCIIGYGRDRNTLIYPAARDIAGVDAKW